MRLEPKKIKKSAREMPPRLRIAVLMAEEEKVGRKKRETSPRANHVTPGIVGMKESVCKRET